MRRSMYLLFTLMLVVGLGCAITDYGMITDNNQSKAGQRNDGATVNTAGKAHIVETSQVATIWPDGTDELFSFVDQKPDGTATITTYNNFSTGSEPVFHSDLYCDSSWSGCAIFSARDDNVGDPFDGSFNVNCAGARSLSVLLSTGRYYGECGQQDAKLSVQEKISLLSSAVEATAFGRTGLLWALDGSNTVISVKNLDNGLTVRVPLEGVRVEHFMSNHGNVAFQWLDHAMVGVLLRSLANKLDNELNAQALQVTINHNGIRSSFTIAGGAAAFDSAAHFRSIANRSF